MNDYDDIVKEILKNKTASTAIDMGGVVYGGFIRDIIIGEPYNDIDIYFFNKRSFIDFLRDSTDVETKDLFNTFGNSFEKMSESHGGEARYIEAGPDGITFEKVSGKSKFGDQCDVLYGGVDLFLNYHIADLDINRLYLSKKGLNVYREKKGNKYVYKDGLYTVGEIINNIQKKFFACEFHPFEKAPRVTKMEGRGWRHNPLLTIQDVIL